MFTPLNWKELAALIEKIRPEIEGLFVDRIIVPHRPQFPDRYLKGEWAIRLSSRKKEFSLALSIRPRVPYLLLYKGKGPQASPMATRSPFDLSLSKHLKGSKLLDLQVIHQERIVIFWFSVASESSKKLGLVLMMIPASPEAFLVYSGEQGWPILSRSRTIREESKQKTHFEPPKAGNPPANLQIRSELLDRLEDFFKRIESALNEEAFRIRLKNAEKNIRLRYKQTLDRIRQSEISLMEAKKEEDWQKLGDLLKGTLFNPPALEGEFRKVKDFESDQIFSIRCDPKLEIQAQVEKFYQNARRKLRRIQEAQTRIERFHEIRLKIEQALDLLPQIGHWDQLEKFERQAGIDSRIQPSEKSKGKEGISWLGKVFLSKDGAKICVGRSRDENLELTFKYARGNDLWMHVRGKPGAHIIVPIISGKTASLETLLDAAHLAIFYSGGENWGKTEVDYTFKKYVKRMKSSTEVIYTHNKTLLINPDPERMKRLFDQNT